MNVLVTGAAGYIGSICAEVLLAQGMKVVALDSLLEGHSPAVPQGAKFCKVDLGNREQIEGVFAQHKIDAVMHFAAEALVAKSMKEPSIFYATNVAGGVNLLDAMTRHGVQKFIFSSTAATYGEPEIVPIPEDHRKSPINPYGKSKLVFEGILADYKSYTGLQYASLRYFNAAGASKERGEHHRVETHLIPRVLNAAAGDLPYVDVFGTDYPTPDGTCVRDYIHVTDLAHAHLAALDACQPGQPRVYNLGSESGSSNLAVLDMCRAVTGLDIPVRIEPRRPGDPAVLVASSARIRADLGWRPDRDLRAMVADAWAFTQSLALPSR